MIKQLLIQIQMHVVLFVVFPVPATEHSPVCHLDTLNQLLGQRQKARTSRVARSNASEDRAAPITRPQGNGNRPLWSFPQSAKWQ